MARAGASAGSHGTFTFGARGPCMRARRVSPFAQNTPAGEGAHHVGREAPRASPRLLRLARAHAEGKVGQYIPVRWRPAAGGCSNSPDTVGAVECDLVAR